MKTRFVLSLACLSLLGWGAMSCHENPQNTQSSQANPAVKQEANVTLKDFGSAPTVLNIDTYSMTNPNFRTTLWTGTKLQVTLMSIPVGGEVGLEIHSDTDQFLRVEYGQARVLMGSTKDSLTFMQPAEKDSAILIPLGTWHNIINTGNTPLKLYSIYAPPHHPHDTIQKTHEDAEAAEAAAHH